MSGSGEAQADRGQDVVKLETVKYDGKPSGFFTVLKGPSEVFFLNH